VHAKLCKLLKLDKVAIKEITLTVTQGHGAI